MFNSDYSRLMQGYADCLIRQLRAFPPVEVMPYIAPLIDKDGTANLAIIIPALNDELQWSKHKIADWLDSLDINIEVS